MTLDSCIEAIKVSVQDHVHPKCIDWLQFQAMMGASIQLVDRAHGWYFDSWGESSKEAYALFWCIDASRLMAVFMQQCERADAEEARAERDEN